MAALVPSCRMSTSANSTRSPGLPTNFSTVTIAPSLTRYCFPPVLITAKPTLVFLEAREFVPGRYACQSVGAPTDAMTAWNTESTRGGPLSALVVVMAKEPRPGRVKTRLCPPLSGEMAARCHEAFVTDTLARVAAAVASRGADRELAVAPSRGAPRLRALAAVGGWRCVDQDGEDLGARMRSRLVAGVAQGKRVILLGSDSPDLPAERILRAVSALEEAEVVVGPAIDGGYYLIGCRDRVPDVFGRGIRWGGATVLQETLARLDASGTSVALLDPWPDVDDWPALVALAERLRVARETDGSPAPEATIGMLAQLRRKGLAV
jgi:hypothetical protein